MAVVLVANVAGRRLSAHQYSARIATVQGSSCMYEEYMKRKILLIKRLQLSLIRRKALSSYGEMTTPPSEQHRLPAPNDGSSREAAAARDVSMTPSVHTLCSHEPVKDSEGTMPKDSGSVSNRGLKNDNNGSAKVLQPEKGGHPTSGDIDVYDSKKQKYV